MQWSRRTRCTPWRVFVGARNEALLYIYMFMVMILYSITNRFWQIVRVCVCVM